MACIRPQQTTGLVRWSEALAAWQRCGSRSLALPQKRQLAAPRGQLHRFKTEEERSKEKETMTQYN